jgi:type IV pilus assembly protein PilO
MSAGGDFIPGDPYEAAPDYPTVFGVRFTPTVSGALLALLGLAGAAAMLFYFVVPLWDEYQQLKAKVEQTEAEIAQQAEVARKIEAAKRDLEVAKKQQQEVQALFATPAALDTLPLDLNRQVAARNLDLSKRLDQRLAACPPGVRQNLIEFEKKFGELASKAELTKFDKPVNASGLPKDGVIVDSAYGPLVNNQLKRQMFSVDFAGNGQQTAAVLESIERLQPMLVVRGFKSALDDKSKNTIFYSLAGQQLSPCQIDPKLKTTFFLEALLPLSSEELATTTTAPKPATK